MADPIDTPEPVAVAAPPTPAAPQRARTIFAGFTLGQLVLGAAVLGLVIWGIWVTRVLVTPREQRIVRADLSRIVGEYVTAQSRSLTPPEKVQAEMKQFMASLDAELGRRSKTGQVVLVGEAVLSKDVTDITADVEKAVYASGVPRPKPASEAEMRQLFQQQQAAQAAAAQVTPPAPTSLAGPMPQLATAPAPAPQSGFADPSIPTGSPVASTETFGGPYGGSD